MASLRRRGSLALPAAAALSLLLAFSLLALPFLPGIAPAVVAAGPLPSSPGAPSALPSPGVARSPLPEVGPPASTVPPCPGLPSGLLTTLYSTNASAGPCSLAGNLSIAPTGRLVVWGTASLILDNASRLASDPIVLGIGGPLVVGGGGLLELTTGTAARVEVNSTLSIGPGSDVVLSPSSDLLLQSGGALRIDGGVVTLEGGSCRANGGEVSLTDGGVWEGSTSLSPLPGRVAHLDVPGSLGSLVDSGSTVEDLNVSSVGSLLVTGADVSNLTVTGSVGNLSISGFYARPSSVSNVTVSTVGTFAADDANLSSILLTSARNVSLGNPLAVQDLVGVDGLTVASPGMENLAIAHAEVERLSVDAVQNVTVTSSVVDAGGSSVTAATGNLTLGGGTRLLAPVQISGGPRATLRNVTAPSLVVTGPATVSVYNWAFNTTNASSGAPALPSIQVSNPHASVNVSRFVLVKVLLANGAPTPPGTSVTLTNALLPNAPTVTLALDGAPSVGTFLPTDRVTFGGDSFVGRYTLTVHSPGYPTVSQPLVADSSGLSVTVTLGQPVLPPQVYPYLLAELAALVAVGLAIVWLRRRIHRSPAGPAPGGPARPDEPLEPGPPSEGRSP